MAIKKTSFGMEDQGQIDRQRMLAQALMSQQHQSGPPQGWNSMPVVPAYGAGNALADSLSSILPQLGGMALDKQADTKQSALNTKTSSGNDALVEALTRQANPMMMKRDESNMPMPGTEATRVNEVDSGHPAFSQNGQMMSQMLQGQDPQQVRQMLSQAMVSKLIPPTPAPYTLGPGQARYENGKQVAAVPAKPDAPEKPMDELSKLNADFKAGRIAKADYDARKLLMTTRAPSQQASFATGDSELLASLAQRGVSLPQGLRSKEQMAATLKGLREKNAGLTPDEIAEKVAAGQIGFGAEKKETSTAAGIAGKTSVGENELIDFIPKALDASARVPRGSFVPFNKLVQLGEKNISDPDLKELYGRTQAILNAYDIVAARGGTDMEKRRHNREMLETADSAATYARAAAVIEDEARIAKKAARKSELPFSQRNEGAAHPQDIQALLDKYK